VRSLKARLGSGLVIALILVFTVQWLLVSLAIQHVTEKYIASRMSLDIDSLLSGLTFNQTGLPEITQEPEGLYNRGPFSGHYYQINASGYVLRSRSFWDQSLDIHQVEVGSTGKQRITGPLDQPLLVLSKGFNKQGYPVTISVAEDMSAVDEGIRTMQQLYLLVTIGLLLLLLLTQQWIVHQSLKSLAATRLNLERVSIGEAEKLPEDVPAEIAPLVREVNVLLELLSRRLVKTRTAVGNLAHALKTPLSMLGRISADPVFSEKPQLQQRFNHQVESIEHALERELNRARLAGDGKSGRRFNPDQDLPQLVNTLQQIHRDKNPDITLNITNKITWPADREDMLELFGNLADNACKWAKSKVRITIENDHAFTVEDDGPGCPADQLESLSQRGLRLDESVSGHGLGLSIVRDIVNHYNGQISFDRSTDLGGLRVRVNLLVPGVPVNKII
jgi:signal transduction histidine kinase